MNSQTSEKVKNDRKKIIAHRNKQSGPTDRRSPRAIGSFLRSGRSTAITEKSYTIGQIHLSISFLKTVYRRGPVGPVTSRRSCRRHYYKYSTKNDRARKHTHTTAAGWSGQ